MLEALLEYQICSALYKECIGVRGQILKALESRKGDIPLMSNLRKVEHDMGELEKAIMNYRPVIITSIETKHRVKFEWLNPPPEQNKPLIKP